MDKIRLVGKTAVPAQSVIYLKAESNYSEVFFTDGSVITLSKTLKKLESLFEPFGFFRPHKSFLINPCHVVSTSVYAERPNILLSNNHQVEISRRKKNDFLEIRRNRLI
ncbi:MAG: LytTR family transcriptional regulator [Leadbetterella sp.]|nr:LytTR family transcriptional regulator [Leadbetterella sp.]